MSKYNKNLTVREAVQNAVDDMTPKFFWRVIDKTRPEHPMFFRDTFFPASRDITTDREVMFWHEIERTHQNFIPPVVCPCDDFDTIPETQDFTERSVKFPYRQLSTTVDCDFTPFLGAGEFVDNARGLGDAIEDAFVRKSTTVDRSFMYGEDLWAAEAVLTGKVTISGKGIKPYELQYQRDDSLNETLTGKAVWGNKGTDNPFDAIKEMNHRMGDMTGGQTNNIIMTQNTLDKMLCSTYVQECMKGFNPSLFYPGLTTSGLMNQEPTPRYTGARIAVVLSREGLTINIWVVNAKYDFVDVTTNQRVQKNLLKDGVVLGFDLGAGDNQFNAFYAYGAIKNMFAGRDRRMKTFARAYVPENGKSLKYEVESSPLPIIVCPNASWSLQVCPEGE